MFICSRCDAQSLKWLGRCTECGQWGTLSEEGGTTAQKKSKAAKPAPVLDLAKATATSISHVPTGLSELDRVLGGGLVPGSVTLLAGEPGIGKSTLVAQIAGTSTSKAYYASGEESEGQVLLRFQRLGIDPKNVA